MLIIAFQLKAEYNTESKWFDIMSGRESRREERCRRIIYEHADMMV